MVVYVREELISTPSEWDCWKICVKSVVAANGLNADQCILAAGGVPLSEYYSTVGRIFPSTSDVWMGQSVQFFQPTG